MLRSSLSRRAGLYRQAYRAHGSGPSNPAHALSGLIKNSTATHLESSILGNLVTKLGLVRAVENVSLPHALSFRSFIHSGKPAGDEAGRTPLSMDNLQGLLNDRENGVYGQQSGKQAEVEPRRAPFSMDNVPGPPQERRNTFFGPTSGNQTFNRPYPGNQPFYRPNPGNQPFFGQNSGNQPFYGQTSGNQPFNGPNSGNQPEGEPGRNPVSMDYVRGLLQGSGNNVGYGRPQLEANADVVHIKLMRNNAFVTVTDSKGNKKIGVSAGKAAGKGAKLTRYSGEAAAEEIGRRVRQMKTRSVVVKVNGFTFFKRKKDAILAFKDGYSHSRGDNPVVYIEDTTRKPHNGCRLPKKRRI